MSRKRRKEQIRKLQNRCQLIEQQAEKEIENAKKQFSEKEEQYLEHIQILTKRLMDGKHYVTERVCVDVAKEYPWMYESSRLPLSEIEEYQERKVTDMMLRELCKRTDLLQRIEHPGHTTFYMEVLKLDDRPIPALSLPKDVDKIFQEDIKAEQFRREYLGQFLDDNNPEGYKTIDNWMNVDKI